MQIQNQIASEAFLKKITKKQEEMKMPEGYAPKSPAPTKGEQRTTSAPGIFLTMAPESSIS